MTFEEFCEELRFAIDTFIERPSDTIAMWVMRLLVNIRDVEVSA